MGAGEDETAAAGSKRNPTRRFWSRAEKGRIVDEAFQPGAWAAGVARGYGLNANQVFNWRRALAVPAKSKRRAAKAVDVSSVGFLPVGMIVPKNDDAPAPSVSVAAISLPDPVTTRYPPGEQKGLIEIILACGIRLRVDAFVDEHTLRRVLSALKASS